MNRKQTIKRIAKMLYEALYLDKFEESIDDFHKNDCITQATALYNVGVRYVKEI